MKICDYNDRQLNKQDVFNQNMKVEYVYDDVEDTFYFLTRIFQTKTDGTKQFPFARFPSALTTPQLLRQQEGWNFVMNAGWYQLQIENSTVLRCQTAVDTMAMTIDQNGTIGYLESWTSSDGPSIVQDGIVSATSAFYPVLVNYEPFDYPNYPDTIDNPNWYHAQRQVFGQYDNGDYEIITGEGRGFNNSTGLTIDREIQICQELGLKFAYNLDGGGSTQTMIGKKRLNNIYEGTDGRLVPGFIVFNGSDTFSIPTP